MIFKPDPRFRHFVAIYRCDILTSSAFKVSFSDTKLEAFQGERTYLVAAYSHAVVAPTVGAEFCFPDHPPISLDPLCQHLILSTRRPPGEQFAQARCEAELDRSIAILVGLYSRDLFRTLVFRGWLRNEQMTTGRGVLVKAAPPVSLNSEELAVRAERAMEGARAAIAPEGRLELMSRLVARGLAEPPSELAFYLLWSALEVFPMVDTAKIGPISDFLAAYLGKDSASVKIALGLGKLCRMRGNLVHNGSMGVSEEEVWEKLTLLELVVTAVLRHASQLPYDGALDSYF